MIVVRSGIRKNSASTIEKQQSKNERGLVLDAGAPISGRHDYLRRLPAEYYRGQAYVHWAMTMQDRKTGWLVPIFYYKFREILTHTMFRFELCCPIYCCMPDHMHFLWAGIRQGSNQRLAMRYFRKQLGAVLEKLGTRFQKQAFDRVLRDEERERSGFEEVFEYIARNPERAGLVTENKFREYKFTDCLVPGYPELKIWQDDFWDRFWRVYAHMHAHGLVHSESDEL